MPTIYDQQYIDDAIARVVESLESVNWTRDYKADDASPLDARMRETSMPTKKASYAISDFKAASNGTPGEFVAVVSVFNNVDQVGDRVMPGAFTKSISRWKQSGDPIPVIWSHDWQNPYAHVGTVVAANETPKGLQIRGKLDVDQPFAAKVHELLVSRRVREFSFAYDVLDESRAKDGANDLNELDLIEVGPTLKGCNPETELIAAKALRDAARQKDSSMDPDEDPGALAQAVDAVIDEAVAALQAGETDQALALLVGAETTVDELLEMLGVVDADDPDVKSGVPTIAQLEAMNRKLGWKLGRRLSTDTMTKMQQIHDGMGDLQDDMKALMGTAYEEDAKGRKSAIAVHHTPTDKGAWDGPATEKKITSPNDAGVSYFGKVYAWRDSEGDATVKASYKFPHHDVSADGTPGDANLTACSTGIGVLNGGMSGTTIPDADREGVYAHLAAHLRDAEMQPPPLKKIEANDKGNGEEPQATPDPKTLLLRTRIAEMRAT